ncbi:UDP-N-acetylglucosamine--undecaprenyl-phosphate N-acetylglucosaminephosphotransferase [Psychromonas sp. 14N.309.X.WAT.B.A12]|jgi:UDP-GlcNAc:undecaprenyl-phosphate/decaprenyl-phosphate GlcNAc-1-phosphate transferase|uniref:UDP-N-acetylglucosamine--undecaprenyl-phosphate N-acetylglucosaminephosphotransferase n=1 Tax=unclassified Psychromonas TaxID=2614957 RepID=UPI0025AEEAF5|nr:UDP-N-acetylglucosamine--undecaprenyl-phosphate N-acetylglucosaminephosphotransferase [Psychromonas sp. 14N.309.X.WAT.B.A12]MDN2664423.1 UDP-N-acetylglucosamine--undecaprenyl-phosphate N-acetylglucosaminephosphotransferase [Psychromonas sp. 14N.309.X.WAT.B.A12]
MLSSMIITSLMSFAVSAFLFYFFHPKAIQFGLVDRADHRKLHKGNIPVIGGPAIYIALVFALFMNQNFTPEILAFVCCAGFLMLLGVIDDKVNLKVSLRLLSMMSITAFLYYFADLQILSLGNLFALGEVELSSFGLLFTIIVVIGVITAFNMVDGVDGLLGCLSIISFSAMALLFAVNGQFHLSSTCVCFIAALIPFLMCNLSLLPGNRYKVFMGDSGSFFIGFTMICLLVAGSQEAMHIDDNTPKAIAFIAFKPVIALWLMAVPVMDMIANIIRRLKNGQSPFQADRGHLHHKLQDIGLSDTQVLIFISLLALLTASIGVIGEVTNAPEVVMSVSLIILFATYFHFYSHSHKVSRIIHGLFGNKANSVN